MSNKKVYLAKAHDASGSDVQYVKSNLLRIPGIEIVELSSGVKPKKCACIVIVPGPNFDEDEGSVMMGKVVSAAVDNFLNNSEGHGLERVYIYSSKSEEVDSHDCEEDTPIAYYCEDFSIEDEDSFDEACSLHFDSYCGGELLQYVSDDIDVPSYGWYDTSRHYSPEAGYAMPPIPEDRSRVSTSNSDGCEAYGSNTMLFRSRMGRR